jgi:SAM-dependent methyltransferase
MNVNMPCPLCGGGESERFHVDRRRPFMRCATCRLVFVPEAYRLDRAAERAEYDLHRNRVDDPGYRRFLSRLAVPLAARLPPGAAGLDFGCGPAPALADMLCSRGFAVSLYDSFYFPDRSVLAGPLDFVSATEVVEHLHRPGAEFERIWQLLRPGGWLGVMTKLVRDRGAFSRWHYKRDPTHVCFFSEDTWRWWAGRHSAAAEFVGADVILVRKPLRS